MNDDQDAEGKAFFMKELEKIRQDVDLRMKQMNDEMAALKQEREKEEKTPLLADDGKFLPTDDPQEEEGGFNVEKALSEDEEEEGEEEEGEEFELPEDVFTLMFFAHRYTSAFLYGILVFGWQLTVLFLITFDLLEDDVRLGEDDGNRFNVPVKVDPQVLVAQVAALLIAIVSRDDVTETFRILAIGYKSRWRKKFPGATLRQYILMNAMRLIEGTLVIFVSFIFIVQSDNVLDIFLNFAAIEFVSNLDNLSFQLAKAGWLTAYMQDIAERMEGMKIILTEEDQKNMRKYPYVKHGFVLVMFGALFAGWGTIYGIQLSGKLLEATSCGIVEVNFGDELFSFESAGDSFTKFEIESRVLSNGFIGRNVAGSTRTIGVNFNESSPPDLIFAFFSGTYYAAFDRDDLIAGRPVYWERNFQDITSGMFYYCEAEQSWVFTVQALALAGALPESTMDRCEHGWLIRSPETDEFSLDEVSELEWKIWTGSLVDAVDFDFNCGECDTDIDCGVTRGTCNDEGECVCKPEYAGIFCDSPAPCTELVNYFTSGYVLFSNSSGYKVYERPLFERPASETEFEVVIYTGRRWYDAYFGADDLLVYLDNADSKSPEEFADDFELNFHAFWGNVLRDNVEYFSEYTNHLTPAGPMEWTRIKETRSVGHYSYTGATETFTQTFACASVDCNINRVCGDYGTCQQVENIQIQGGSETLDWDGGQCFCEGNVTGHFCEFFNGVKLDENGTVLEPPQDIDPYLAACLGPFANWTDCWIELYGLTFEEIQSVGGKTSFNGTIDLSDLVSNETRAPTVMPTTASPTPAPTVAPSGFPTMLPTAICNLTEYNITDLNLTFANITELFNVTDCNLTFVNFTDFNFSDWDPTNDLDVSITTDLDISISDDEIIEDAVTTPLPTPPPTPEPSSTPTVFGASIIRLLKSVSFDGGEALEDTSSPQASALNWLLDNVDLDSFPDEQLIQRYALASMYYSLGGPLWSGDASRWLSDILECRWTLKPTTEPLCDRDGAYIVLDMRNIDARGTIPNEIGLLTKLQFLQLSGGPTERISGSLPTELGLLTDLIDLKVDNNELVGDIPTEVQSLSKLEIVDMSVNSLSGTIPAQIGAWTALQYLDLSSNQLPKRIPTEIGRLQDLTKVYLHHNLLSGDVPTEMGELINVTNLRFDFNDLNTLPNEIGGMSALTTLWLHRNNFSGTLSTTIGRLTNLKTLDARFNSFSGTLATELAFLTNINDRIDLSFNQLTGTIPTEFGRLTSMHILNLNNNMLSNPIPLELASLTKLNTLRLDRNDFEGEMPVDVCSSFNETLPTIYADCEEMACPCCNYCCFDGGVCACRYFGTPATYLCF